MTNARMDISNEDVTVAHVNNSDEPNEDNSTVEEADVKIAATLTS